MKTVCNANLKLKKCQFLYFILFKVFPVVRRYIEYGYSVKVLNNFFDKLCNFSFLEREKKINVNNGIYVINNLKYAFIFCVCFVRF